MTPLEQQAADYLRIRRALGFKLERAEKLLAEYLAYLGTTGQDRVTVENALARPGASCSLAIRGGSQTAGPYKWDSSPPNPADRWAGLSHAVGDSDLLATDASTLRFAILRRWVKSATSSSIFVVECVGSTRACTAEAGVSSQ